MRQLEVIKKKARKLEKRGYITAAASAFNLYDSLSENYIHLDSIQDFKNKCAKAIKEARPELEKHRGWKQVLGNLALAIGLNILYVPAVLLNKMITGNFLFFETDSARKINDFERTLDQTTGLQK